MTDLEPLVIIPVSNARQLKAFIRTPREIYRGLPGHDAPLDIEQRDLVDPARSAFFRNGRAQYFLATRGTKIVGRISAQIDQVGIEHWGENIGLFGAFDCIDDPAVAQALIDAAAGWLRAQGMTRMRGPWTLNPNGEMGVMIEGQNAAPMIAMPWHPAGLGALAEAAGMNPVMDLLAYQMAIGADAERAHILPAGLRLGEGQLGAITTRGLDMKNLTRDGEILRKLYNDAWSDSWGSIPLQDYEVAAMISQLKPILRPEHYVLVERSGVPVAVALVIPNLHDVSHDLGGAPSPLGWIKLATRLLRHKFTSARVILLGVSSSVQGTALGAILPALVIAELMQRGRDLPYTMVELGWILETNMPMRRLIERLVPTPCKRYRMYEKVLAD